MAVARLSVQAVRDSFGIGDFIADALGFVAGSLGFSPYFVGFVNLLLQSNGAGIM